MRTIAWRAYYNDGRMFDSATTTFEALPRKGIVVVLEYLDAEWAPGKHYRNMLTGGDWYWLEDIWRFIPTGDWGTWRTKPTPRAIRSTRVLPEKVYDEVLMLAMRAEDLP